MLLTNEINAISICLRYIEAPKTEDGKAKLDVNGNQPSAK